MRNTAQSPFPEGTYYLHQNGRGDVVAVSDNVGALVEKTTFEAFGAPDRSSSVGNPYLFQGRRLDPETGFYYFRHRYYDPRAGRFVQRDPVWDAGNAGNQYTFVGNGPISGLDPMGLEEWTWYERSGTFLWGSAKGLGKGFIYGIAEGLSFGMDVMEASAAGVHDMFADVPMSAQVTPKSGLGLAIYHGKGTEAVTSIVTELPQRMIDSCARSSELCAQGKYDEAGSAFGEGFLLEFANLYALGRGTYAGYKNFKAMPKPVRAQYIRQQFRVGLTKKKPIDPVTADIMQQNGMTPETPLYRYTEPQYIDLETGLARANPEPTAYVRDFYNATDWGHGIQDVPKVYASDLPHPGLNVAREAGGI